MNSSKVLYLTFGEFIFELQIYVEASTFDVETNQPLGIHIQNGVVHKNDGGIGYTLTYNKNTQELKAYPPNIDGNTLVSTYGVTDAWSAFFPIIDNHMNVGPEVWSVIANSSEPNPREVIAQLDDKTILFFTFRGREDDHIGYTYPDMQTVLQSFNVKFAYNLDGGGSTQMVKDNILINVPIDGNYGDERQVMDFISVKKTTSKAYEVFYNTVGELSAIVRKLDARHISKYGDEIPGRLTFKDFFYLALDKALYGYDEVGDPQRLLGIYTDSDPAIPARVYVGDPDIPMSLYASNNILVHLTNDTGLYRVNLTKSDAWQDIPLTAGITHFTNRNLQYKEMNAFEVRIRGAAALGITYAVANQVIGTLPAGVRPIKTMVIPVSILAGAREPNDVIINTDGTIQLRFAVTAPTSGTAVQIECVINKEV
jgi:hypothetical protein